MSTTFPPSSYIYAPNKLINIGQCSIAIRELSQKSQSQTKSTPILLLNHWGANLDDFDPRIIDKLAEKHHIIAVNYRGVGSSTGSQKLSVHLIALDIIKLINVLGYDQVDLFGFSLGGFVAQEITIFAPQLVRKLILVGTGPKGGKGFLSFLRVPWLFIKSFVTLRDPKFYLFFPPNKTGKLAAETFLSAIKQRQNRESGPSLLLYLRQLIALTKWDLGKPHKLEDIRKPTLIVNGDHDLMLPSKGSHKMSKKILNSQLVIYPNSGHGSHFQNHNDFTDRLLDFLH